MDKYEYKLKLDQMKALAAEGDYMTAAEIADSINWKKVRNVNLLVRAGDVYTKQGRYDDAREVLIMACGRSPLGRMIIYRLAKLAIKMKNFEEAEERYDDFVEIAPHDNLKYVLRYKICKAKGTDLATQIRILEEYKEVEYTEEWAYELAYLYHQAGEQEKCIDACDELILWFGEGVYVERAMELKMIYRPLTQSQEEKYRSIRQRRDGVKEVYSNGTDEMQTIQIPVVSENMEKFNTTNLQEELAKSMQQIMEATKKETVDSTMNTVKKMVEDIPYLQMPQETEAEKDTAGELEEEQDSSLKIDFKGMLAEDYDGQISLLVDGKEKESQIHGQMSIEDVLDEWERKQRAVQAAYEMVQQKKLESAKARALQDIGDLMESLEDAIPKIDEGMTPAQFLRENYLAEGNLTNEEDAGKFMEGMNNVLQQEIERRQEEAEKEHELLRRIKQAKPNFDEQIGLKSYVPQQFEVEDGVLPVIADPFEEEKDEVTSDEALSDEALSEEMRLAEAEFYGKKPEEMEQEADEPIVNRQDTKEIKTQKISEALDRQVQEMQQEETLGTGEQPILTKLNDKQREIFSYFVPVDGMEKQICQVLTGAMARISDHTHSATGHILIQGGKGCGKTVLATGIIKALQREVNRPKGKVGKIDANALNKKDLSELLKKVSGGCLIIEQAGEMNRETAVKLSLLLEQDTSGILVIMEDTRTGLNQVLAKDESLAKKFTEKITIPVFTSDELVEFGKKYARDREYDIDNMGVLALYNRISNIQRLDQATTLTEVKEIIDEAIEKAEKKSLKKAFSIISRRYAKDDYVILKEKDFEE